MKNLLVIVFCIGAFNVTADTCQPSADLMLDLINRIYTPIVYDTKTNTYFYDRKPQAYKKLGTNKKFKSTLQILKRPECQAEYADLKTTMLYMSFGDNLFVGAVIDAAVQAAGK